jgi:hypothetical protein
VVAKDFYISKPPTTHWVIWERERYRTW